LRASSDSNWPLKESEAGVGPNCFGRNLPAFLMQTPTNYHENSIISIKKAAPLES